MKHILFDNYEGTYPFEDAKQNCIEMHLEDYPDDKDWQPSDEEVFEEIHSVDEINWDDISGLMRNFFDNGDTYLLRGTLGLWNGPADCGKVITSYNDLSEAFSKMDYVTISDVDGQFEIDAIHHDGSNHYEVRKLKRAGEKYLDSHKNDDPRSLHLKLWDNEYSMKLHFYKKEYC